MEINMKGSVALYISSLKKGGAERVIVNIANYLKEQGYMVTVVTTYKAEEEYAILPDIHRIISEPENIELKDGRIKNFLIRFFGLRKIWKDEKPDLILSFIGKNNFMAILTSIGLGISTAVSVRGDPKEEYPQGLMRILAKILFVFADGVILQTSQCRSFFPRSVRKKTIILKNPMNTSFFKERYEGQRENTITAVGRIDENKNHKMLILAFAEIANEFPEYNLIIYGEGEKKEELQRLVKELELENRINMPGSIDNVADIIYKTRVFVLSSNTEGMPNTLLEAMALGLTVISTDCPCGGPAELIDHGINGLLSPVGDKTKMKENLQFVLNNLQESDLMGRNAKITSEIYHPEKVLAEWENYLIFLGLGHNRRQ